MNVVLDTNVLVSGLLTRTGPCATILDLVVDGRLTAVFDNRMMAEYRQVCAEPRLRLDPAAVQEVLRFLNDDADSVTAMPLNLDLPDPDDLPFLEVAAETQAVLVTGNKKHFPQTIVTPIQVASPRELLDILRLS